MGIFTFYNDNTINQKYYSQIIYKIQMYINSKPSIEKTIYIFDDLITGYSFYNNSGKDITYKYFEKYILKYNEINYSDFLFDTLIEIAPYKVILNCTISENLKYTLYKLFPHII